MVRKLLLALTLTLALTMAGTVTTFAAQGHGAGGVDTCTPTITIPGWGWGSGPDHVGMGVTYTASCAASATVTFSAMNPDGKTVWTQRYHHYTLSTVETEVDSDWVVKTHLPSGVYTLRFEIASANGQIVYTSFDMGTVTLPLS
jgi:hypothetical protein